MSEVPMTALSAVLLDLLLLQERDSPSRGGPLYPVAGAFVPRWARPFRGGLVRPEAGLCIPRRARPFRGGPVCPEAGLFVMRRTRPTLLVLSRARPCRGGPIRSPSSASSPG